MNNNITLYLIFKPENKLGDKIINLTLEILGSNHNFRMSRNKNIP